MKTDDPEKIYQEIQNLAGPAFPLFEAKQAAEAPPTVEPGDQTNSEKPSDVVDAEFTEVKKDAE